MGCDHYSINQPQGGGNYLLKHGFSKPVTVMFSEGDDETACLCTFPHNYKPGDDLPVESLALLGAAIVLGRRGVLAPDSDDDFGIRTVQSAVPQWIKDAIKKAVK